ncbi:hypothetical protein KKB18_04875, partial [bacterium]|nr:hypothetical protein [bacterium]
MTIINYSNLSDWQGPKLHFVDCDVGPDGDVTSGKVAIHGDRWKHKRLGIATAPGATILQPVDAAAIEAPYMDIYESGGAFYIPILRTKGFNDGDSIFVEDKNGSEVLTITAVNENQSLQIPMPSNTYSINDNLLVSSIPDIHISKNEDITAGDYIEVCEKDGKNKIVCCIMPDCGSFQGVDNTTYTEKTIIRVIRLAKAFRKDDYVSILNTSTKWVKNAANPIIGLQRECPWDWAGQDVSSAEFLTDVDVMDEYEAPDGKKVSWRKPGLFLTGSRERGSSQIGLMLSGKEDDTENWSSFLGDTNPARPNPIIRHSNETELFNYADTADLKKLWDTKDGSINVTFANLSGNSCMQIDYTGDGEVWGLCPVPFNGEVRTDEANLFQFQIQGDAGNTQGDVYIKLLAADGTSFIQNFEDVLQLGFMTDKSFDFNDPVNIFPGRKYIKSVVVGISTGGAASGTIYIDRLKPFLPPAWDEIVEDPTVIQGNLEETPGVHAIYFTARQRPRQVITAITGTAGATSCVIDVPSTENFDAGDKVILYDRDNYEIGMVETVNSGTRLTVQHVSFDEDISARFDFDYSTSKQAMIANNTYRINKIGGAYVLTEDCSDWEKWITDDNSQPVLIPGASETAWDSLSVKQPSVRIYGNDVYMAYVGCCSGNTESIGFAKSSNFTTFTKLEGNPYIVP